MIPRIALAGLACGFLVSACAAPEAPVDPAAVQAEVVAAMAGYREAVLAGNADSVVDYLTADVRVLEPGMNLSGSEAREFFHGLMTNAAVHSFEVRPYDHFVHGNVVYELGEYDEVVEMEGQTHTVEGFYFLRWERGEDGKWRFERVMTSPRAAPAGM